MSGPTESTMGDKGVDPQSEGADVHTASDDEAELPDTTDENGRPLDNPSG